MQKNFDLVLDELDLLAIAHNIYPSRENLTAEM
jgi:hypothetical protein